MKLGRVRRKHILQTIKLGIILFGILVAMTEGRWFPWANFAGLGLAATVTLMLYRE